MDIFEGMFTTLAHRGQWSFWTLNLGSEQWRLVGRGRVNICRPEGCGFESRSSHHVGTLGKSLTRSCLWRFSVKLWHSIHAVSGVFLGSSYLKRCYRNCLNEWMKMMVFVLVIWFQCLALMVLPFIPASNLFFPVGFVVAERILYAPSMGFCLLVACGFEALLSHSRRSVWSVAILICGFLDLLTGKDECSHPKTGWFHINSQVKD